MIFNELIKNTIFVFIIKHTLSTKILKKFEPANIYGNLTQTIIQLINQSSSGLHAEEVGDLIDYAPHSLLHRLAEKATIRREKLNGKYAMPYSHIVSWCCQAV